LSLPGNPVSTMVSFLLFVRPAIRDALGLSPFDLPRAQVTVEAPVRARGDRRSYVRARVRFDAGELLARPMAQQGSHQLTSMLGANGLLVVEPGQADVPAGGRMPALIIGPLG
jgi:molybdopterin molybdotransferase